MIHLIIHEIWQAYEQTNLSLGCGDRLPDDHQRAAPHLQCWRWWNHSLSLRHSSRWTTLLQLGNDANMTAEWSRNPLLHGMDVIIPCTNMCIYILHILILSYYVYTNVCINDVRMNVWVHVWVHIWVHVCADKWRYVWMYVWMDKRVHDLERSDNDHMITPRWL